MKEQPIYKGEIFSLTVAQFVSFIFFILALIPAFAKFKGDHGIGFYQYDITKAEWDWRLIILIIIAGCNGFRIFLSSIEVEENPAYESLIFRNQQKYIRRIDWLLRVCWLLIVLIIPISLEKNQGQYIEVLLVILFLLLTIWDVFILSIVHKNLNEHDRIKVQQFIQLMKCSFLKLNWDIVDCEKVIRIKSISILDGESKESYDKYISDLPPNHCLKLVKYDEIVRYKELIAFRRNVRFWLVEELISLVISVLYLYAAQHSTQYPQTFFIFLGFAVFVYGITFLAEFIYIDWRSYLSRTVICLFIATVIYYYFY